MQKTVGDVYHLGLYFIPQHHDQPQTTFSPGVIGIFDRGRKGFRFAGRYRHAAISKSSFDGRAGNAPCGSRWYQYTTEEMSDFCG